ncbi:ester cyclase [Agromyces sp. SYSU K20354]|uniref:ester cyclase n=1 Tax=Agromyces cavernae TaxID=2898659 RepID=UPI001E3C765B|nr:ester cyclase [Agromyces cavernae]MCD2442160.1 ester cyclase [Agromyces cavernae]
MTDSRESHAIVARFYEAINSGALDDLDAICSPDLQGHAGAGSDLTALKASIGAFIAAFPDLIITPRHVVAESDLVSTWLVYAGRHGGEFAGVPATGRAVRFAAWDLMRIRDGRVAEITQYCDLFTLMNQIGALPTTTPA